MAVKHLLQAVSAHELRGKLTPAIIQ